MIALSASRHDRAGAAPIRELDWLMLVVVALCCLGLVMAVSVRGSQVDVGPMAVMRDQGSKVLVGLVLFLLASIVPMRTVRQWALPLFVVATVACLLPLALGQKVNGAYRWIKIGSQTLQPVEPARFCWRRPAAASAAFAPASCRRWAAPRCWSRRWSCSQTTATR